MGHYFPSASSTICTRCGYSGNTHTHTFTSTVVPPTCTEIGYTQHTCACGESYQDTVTAALGHSYTGSSTVCSRCGYSSHTHSYSTTVIAPTCTAGGYTQHTCSCGDSYQDSVTAALGHSYSGSSTVCSRCGYSGHTHSYTSTVVAPTCTEGGYTLHVCECGDRYEDTPTAARGHFFVTPSALVCTRCGYNRGTGTYSLNTYALNDSAVTEEYKYTYNGSSLTQMVLQTTQGSSAPVTTTLNFSYDASGMPLTVEYNGTMYYYVSNVQGDVVGILNSSGTKVVSYTYDAWGNILSTTGSMASTLGAYNPLRYRGYVYDTETGLYYLQSRYYDPELGRFINADGYMATGQGFVGNNMFAYCLNNPVNFVDTDGADPEAIFAWWASSMAWLMAVDGLAVFGDAVYGAGLLVLGLLVIVTNTGSAPVTEEWLDTQTKGIEEGLVKSLAKTTPPQNEKYHVHHIVAQNDRRAAPARYILECLNIDVNSIFNLVLVKASIHQRLHTTWYYNTVNHMVMDAFLSAGMDKRKQLENVTGVLKFLQTYIYSLNALAP